ncbi:MAG: ATP-binding protein [Lachnospiraceae bacterium]|nr:ATP-binding protein [Lachnospiraceae bacterium]
MITKFSVQNFKGFQDNFTFDLTQSNYEFNQGAVRNGIVNKGLIYGFNGCGKSNLGLAIFDLVLHLTDKQTIIGKYPVYLNLDSNEKYASFSYSFVFDGVLVEYSYTKVDPQVLRTEELIINGEPVIGYDFEKETGFSNLDGTQNLRLNSPDSRLSKLKFIKNNAILAENETNLIFIKFMDFVERMLLFYSLDGNAYQGFTLGVESLDDVIVKEGKLKDFERLLKKADINMNLESQLINNQNVIFSKYKNGLIPFERSASRGTNSLELFYFWYIRMSKASFVFIDEFDAFYHYELSELIIRELLKLYDTQIILTTHNTDLLTNDLLRPDCYYIMNPKNIVSIANSTEKELRKAHNLQKMFKAGAFNE